MAGMLQDVVNSIFDAKPGDPAKPPEKGLVKAMNLSFYGLFVTLAGLAYVTSFNKHVLLLSAVAVALFLSIQWFIVELKRLEEQNKNAQSDQKGEIATTASSSHPFPNQSAESNVPGNVGSSEETRKDK